MLDHTGEKCNRCDGKLIKSKMQSIVPNYPQENITIIGHVANKFICDSCGLFHLFALEQ